MKRVVPVAPRKGRKGKAPQKAARRDPIHSSEYVIPKANRKMKNWEITSSTGIFRFVLPTASEAKGWNQPLATSENTRKTLEK